MFNMNTAAPLSIFGERTTGNSVRTQNVLAASTIANIVKSSFGPIGLDKMLVDDVGDVTITNDGATILKQLEVEHPAAKILVELAQLQDDEVGDGTTTVVILAAELLKRADDLVAQKVHPTSIIAGYRLACREAIKFVNENLIISSDELGRESVLNAAKTSMASKVIATDADFFSHMALTAAESIKTIDAHGEAKYPIKAINILKAHGKQSRESVMINGYALNCTVASQAMPRQVLNAKIACIDFSLNRVRLKLGVQVLVDDPDKLDAIRQREMDITKERVQKIVNSGATVILTSGGIDDLCLKYLVEAGVIGVRRCLKRDLKRIAKATGGQLVLTMANLEGEESFDSSALGQAESVSTERICDDELIVIRGTKARSSASIILRGANYFHLDEVERSLHDALCVIKRVLESKKLVAGGGAVETQLSIHLETFSNTIATREQLAIAEFANALLTIPKQLAINAALDASELCAKLRAHHNIALAQPNAAQTHKWFGLDLVAGAIRDNRAAGVFEPAMSKIKSFRFATEAAITILRIDDMIKVYPEQSGGQHDDDDC